MWEYVYFRVRPAHAALVVRWKSASIATKVPEPIRGLLIKFGVPKVIKKEADVTGRERYRKKIEDS